MSLPELPSEAATILSAASSPATCLPTTIVSLKRLLSDQDYDDPAEKPLATDPTSSVRKTQPRAHRSVRKGGRRDAPMKIFEESQCPKNTISMRQKSSLAKQVFNATLQSLTVAAKEPGQNRLRKIGAKTTEVVVPGGSTKHVRPGIKAPLDPIPVNRLSTSPHKRKDNSSSSMPRENSRELGLHIQAVCACEALDALRRLELVNGPATDTPCLQLENGMSALISKLIALGFYGLASQELKILKARIDGSDFEGKSTRNGERLEDGLVSCASQLLYTAPDVNGPCLSLTITSQLQALRLISETDSAGDAKAILNYLDIDAHGSLVNLIEVQVALKLSDSQAKSVQQLRSLCHLILALCPKSSEMDYSSDQRRKCSVDSETVFCLQVLALQVQAKWWVIAGYEGNIFGEVLQPFSEYLSAFSQRPAGTAIEKYHTCRRGFNRISSAFKLQERKVLSSCEPRWQILLNIYQNLACLAQECSDSTAADQWWTEAQMILAQSKAPPYRLCALTCRKAIAYLRQPFSPRCDHDLQKKLFAVSNEMRPDVIRGTQNIDELVIASHDLRRAIMPLLHDTRKIDKAFSGNLPQETQFQCRRILLQVLQCLHEHIVENWCPTSTKTSTAQDRGNRCLGGVIKSYIESIVLLARSSACQDRNWEIFDEAIEECSKTLTEMQHIVSVELLFNTDAQYCDSIFVSMSEIYWTRFQLFQGDHVTIKGAERALGLSVTMLLRASNKQQIVSLLATRLEKQGLFYEKQNKYRQAASSYEQALGILLEGEISNSASAAAANHPISELFCQDGLLYHPGRLLTAHVKAVLQIQDSDTTTGTVIDDEKLPKALRGLLLEQQLKAIEERVLSGHACLRLCRLLQHVMLCLLSIYDQQTFPIRRLRTCCRILGLCSISKVLLPQDTLNSLVGVRSDNAACAVHHQDRGLQKYETHLVASHSVSSQLLNEKPDLQVVVRTLEQWSGLLTAHSDYRSLCCYVDDLSSWLLQLDMITDLFGVNGYEVQRASALKLLHCVHLISGCFHGPAAISTLSDLGAQYTRIGNTKDAGLALHKAQRYLNSPECTDLETCRWHLAYAEYLLCISGIEESKEHIDKAQKSLNAIISERIPSQTNPDLKRQVILLIAEAAGICSRLSSYTGRSTTALYFCRLRVKRLHGLWTDFKRGGKGLSMVHQADAFDTTNTNLTAAMASMLLSESQSWPTASAAPKRTSLHQMSNLIPRLFDSLINLSEAYAYEGLFAEAQYYLEQADRVAQNVGAPSFKGRYQAQAGHYEVRGGRMESSTALFEQALASQRFKDPDHNFVKLHTFLAEKYLTEGDFKSAEAVLCTGENALNLLSERSSVDSDGAPSQMNTLGSQMRQANLEDAGSQPSKKRNHHAMSGRPHNSGPGGGGHAGGVATKHCLSESAVTFQTRMCILRYRSTAAMSVGSLDHAEALLDLVPKDHLDLEDSILQTLLNAQIRFRRTLRSLASDLTFSILPESVISCPTVRSTGKERGEERENAPRRTGQTSYNRNTKIRKAIAKSVVDSLPKTQSSFGDLLQLIQNELSQVCIRATNSASTDTVHTVFDVLARALLMLSAVGTSLSKGWCNPMSIVFVTEVGRMVAAAREKSTIQIERQLLLEDNPLDWPNEGRLEGQPFSAKAVSDPLAFRQTFIDILPTAWCVITISSSVSTNQLRIVKLRRGRDPFAVSIPLDRRSSQEPDGVTFNIDQARAEMRDIITLANYSSHSVPDTTRKGAKREWWDTRAALDARLKSLLHDIESTWFGGFRGLFCRRVDDENLLLRFGRNFQSILDRHLPSRQKQVKASKQHCATVDHHVLELFTALGNPNDADLDDDLTDLLYFVVDSLQFCGERNAYDEIDFDSISVEVLDALRQYHAAAEVGRHQSNEQHTILVLDKALHSFPWESLDSLRGQAVSRVPSLQFLRDRILQQNGLARLSADCFTVNRSNGTYLLNPSGDLAATQSTFEESLSRLSDWESLVDREPNEEEMKKALESKDILLYFGHGSGGQYIRSRTVKRLGKCAVALLMGCSSGTMTEAGTYESYGTPLNYMQAGCPALLATLWDVTDKDIDRFSQTTLEKWGLIDLRAPIRLSANRSLKTGSPVKRGSPVRKGEHKETRGEENQTSAWSERLSLDQAVAQSRDSCIMKYLNGAAPVVYGIPVFLS